MEVKELFGGLLLLTPRIFADRRGYFFESFNNRAFAEATGLKIDFVQDNESCSSRSVVRGLHYQLPPAAQSKLVRVIEGTVVDVAVDIRRGSPTFGHYAAVELDGQRKQQLFIPRGFAHGFAVMSQTAVFQYKCDNYYSPQNEGSIALDDPTLNIRWPVDKGEMILSDKDANHPLLDKAVLFDYNDKLY